jgi:hypothetical protein
MMDFAAINERVRVETLERYVEPETTVLQGGIDSGQSGESEFACWPILQPFKVRTARLAQDDRFWPSLHLP